MALLDRVVQNLFSNAAKYVPDGGVVAVEACALARETVLSFFTSGAPLPEEKRPSLFQKLGRIDNYTSLGSKGLGLCFCRLVTEEHDGTIVHEPREEGNCLVLRSRVRRNGGGDGAVCLPGVATCGEGFLASRGTIPQSFAVPDGNIPSKKSGSLFPRTAVKQIHTACVFTLSDVGVSSITDELAGDVELAESGGTGF